MSRWKWRNDEIAVISQFSNSKNRKNCLKQNIKNLRYTALEGDDDYIMWTFHNSWLIFSNNYHVTKKVFHKNVIVHSLSMFLGLVKLTTHCHCIRHHPWNVSFLEIYRFIGFYGIFIILWSKVWREVSQFNGRYIGTLNGQIYHEFVVHEP